MPKKLIYVSDDLFDCLLSHDPADFLMPSEFKKAIEKANDEAAVWLNPLELFLIARRAEGRLIDGKIPETMRPGFEVIARPRGPKIESSTKRVASRQYTLRRVVKNWVLGDIKKCVVFPRTPEKIIYRATDQQYAEIQRRSISDIQRKAA